MDNNDNSDLKVNLKEAADLLDCMHINDEKLQKIANIISEKIKGDDNVKHVLEKVSDGFDDEKGAGTFAALMKVIDSENAWPTIQKILTEMGEDTNVIEHIEKKIFPILFSR